MKILHVLTSARAEGTPRLVLDWLALPDHDQEVLFLESKPDDLKEEFSKFKTNINPKLRSGLKKIPQIVSLTKKIVRCNHYDMVICWNTGLSPWVLSGAKFGGSKKLIAHNGNAPGSTFLAKYIYSYLIYWINWFLGAKVICCSEYIKNEYLKIPFLPKSIFYSIYNCINISNFIYQKRSEAVKKFIMVATLEPHKDHKTLLKAWQIVEKSNPEYALSLVGSGSLEKELKKLHASLNLKNVEFLGSRKDVPQLLENSDVFIFSTTVREGFGTVLIEALASGLTIIASDVPACREVLQQGRFGILVPPQNETLMAKYILKIGKNRPNISEFEINQYIQTFSAYNMMKSYIDVSN